MGIWRQLVCVLLAVPPVLSACNIRDPRMEELGGAAGVAAMAGMLTLGSAGPGGARDPGGGQAGGGASGAGSGEAGASGALLGGSGGEGGRGAARAGGSGGEGGRGGVSAGGSGGEGGRGGASAGGSVGEAGRDGAAAGGGAGETGAGGASLGGRTSDAGEGGALGAAGGATSEGGRSGSGGEAAASGAGGEVREFRGGPCVTQGREADEAYIYARGSDHAIYRAVATPDGVSAWVAVPALDGALLAEGETNDLDCSRDARDDEAVIHIVGPGRMPLGSVRHAYGFDLEFTGFTQLDLPSTYDSAPSVWSQHAEDWFLLAATERNPTNAVEGFSWIEVSAFGQGHNFEPAPPVEVPVISAIDVTGFDNPVGARRHYFAAYSSNGSLQLLLHDAGGWDEPQYFEPPPGTHYEHSPAVAHSLYFRGNRLHLVAVAGGHIWYTSEFQAGWSLWQQVTDAEVVSGVDCAVSGGDDAVHIVALTTAGTIVYARGVYGSSTETFTVTDLGVFE